MSSVATPRSTSASIKPEIFLPPPLSYKSGNFMKLINSIFYSTLFVLSHQTNAADANMNGMSDLFEAFYGVSDPSDDPDGDSQTNLQESFSGTSPLSAASSFKTQPFTYTPGLSWTLQWQSVNHKYYKVQISSALTSWSTVTATSLRGDGSILRYNSNTFFPASPDKTFYRVTIAPTPDLDGDGYDEWEEATFLGTSDLLIDDDGDLIPSSIEVLRGSDPLSSLSPANPNAYLATALSDSSFEVYTESQKNP